MNQLKLIILVLHYRRSFLATKLIKTLIYLSFILLVISCSTYVYKQNKKFVLFETTFAKFDDIGVPSQKETIIKLDNDSNNYMIVESKIDHVAGRLKYLYAFRNDTLIYFGYPYQFSQSSDSTINELGVHYNTKIKK